MKKLAILLFSLFLSTSVYGAELITVDAFVSPDDVTIAHLEQFRTRTVNAINSFPGSNVQTATIPHDKLDANADPVNRWNEAFNDFVYTGLLPTVPGSGLILETPAGTAYVNGMRVIKAATSPQLNTPNDYNASKDTYVDLSSSGVYTYQAVANGAAAPATTTNSIRLFKVVTNATDITSVVDLRVTSVNLSSIYEDFNIKGMNIRAVTTDDTVTVDSGVLYNGSYRVAKTTNTGIHLDTANDWHDAAVDTYTAPDWCYIGVDNTGNVKFVGNNPPDKADTSGNTAGTKRYWYSAGATKYWRIIGAVSVDASNNIALPFTQIGSEAVYDTMRSDVGGATTATWSTIELSNIPATARIAKLIVLQNSGGSEYVIIREGGNVNASGLNFASVASSGQTGGGTYAEVLTNTSQQIDWRQGGGATQVCYIWTVGYIDETR